MEKNTKLEIYPNKKGTFEKELKRLEKSDISQRNKELITGFQNYLFSTGSRELRVAKLTSQMRYICRWLKYLNITKNLDLIIKKDLMTLLSFINTLKEKSEATKSDYRRVLKQFYRWYKEEDNRFNDSQEERFEADKIYKYIEKEISGDYKREQADPSTIITDEDAFIVIDKGARTTKEKAFISCLHEWGCRAGELLNLKIGSIILKENYAEIHLPDGKTGKRMVYSTKSLPYLLKYLDVHPYKASQNAYLWLSDARFNLNKPLLHKGAQKLINRCFDRTEITKKHNLHWFRHSRATLLAPKMTEVILCKYMGWSIGSRQVKTYCHLSVKQLEDVVLSLNGIKPKEQEENKPLSCICGALNNPNERYCFKCFKPLKVETIIQDKELVDSEINKTVQFIIQMANNPDLMKMFKQFIKNNNN